MDSFSYYNIDITYDDFNLVPDGDVMMLKKLPTWGILMQQNGLLKTATKP